jgi:HlyD family secretion protein
VLKLKFAGGKMTITRNWQIAGGVVLLLALATWWFMGRTPDVSADLTIETAAVERGNVRRIVAASGAVRALVTVEVGSQVSGQISELLVDFNDPVEAGQIIARIDPQSFETRVREAVAARATAEANLNLQRAGLERVRATVQAAQQDHDRIETLHARGTASQAALDIAVTSLNAASAEFGVALAQIENAEAVVQQREATLDGARIDLERALIRAPISGVVVDRAVDEGQTVAASLSAPTLFTIAQDLSRIQVDAQIDEADIGQIAEGQSVTFTVDAYPGVEMAGRVEQTRLAPTTLQNVVTYTVVVSADNPGQRLLPGMTANLDIITGERVDVLTVSNIMLRFRPSSALEARSRPLAEAQPGGRPGRGGQGGRPGGRRGGGQMQQLIETLDLSPEQADQIREASQAVFSRARSVAESGGEIDRAAMQAEIATVMQSILTPDQMRQYREQQREARETRRATVWVEEADGTLVERRIRVGIGDSQRTEVVGGQLEEGEAVVERAREARR